MKTPADNTEQISNERLEVAKKDFNELMSQIEPFIKQSTLYHISTEGKWSDNSSMSDTVVLKSSNNNFVSYQ